MNVLDFVLAGLLLVSLVLFARLHSRYQRLQKQRSREVRMITRPLAQQVRRLVDADQYLSLSAELKCATLEAEDFGELRRVLQSQLPQFDLPDLWKVEVSDQGSPYFFASSDGAEEQGDQLETNLLHEHLVEVEDKTVRFLLPETPDEESFHLEMIAGDICRAIEQIRNSFTDSDTGIWSRRYLEMRLGEEIERAHRHRHWVSLLMLDGDHFKQINDTYGHRAGDEVILKISRVLREIHHRSSDVVARYGNGDEFLVLLPETRPDKALEDAERTRKALAETKTQTARGIVSFTCSIGVYSVLPNNVATDIEKMLGKADEALYRAKARGGNCVVAEKDGFLRGNSGQ